MLIRIKCDDDTLELSDENSDNNNFVDLRLIQEGAESSTCVSIDDLEAAVIAFKQKRSNLAQRDYEINLSEK